MWRSQAWLADVGWFLGEMPAQGNARRRNPDDLGTEDHLSRGITARGNAVPNSYNYPVKGRCCWTMAIDVKNLEFLFPLHFL